MKDAYKYLLILTVGFFFIISACELSTKHFTNTFDDVYDYYLRPDNNILPHVNFSLNFEVFPALRVNLLPKIYYCNIPNEVSYYFYRQFQIEQLIKNSVLLI